MSVMIVALMQWQRWLVPGAGSAALGKGMKASARAATCSCCSAINMPHISGRYANACVSTTVSIECSSVEFALLPCCSCRAAGSSVHASALTPRGLHAISTGAYPALAQPVRNVANGAHVAAMRVSREVAALVRR
jgi:hypothetical protein